MWGFGFLRDGPAISQTCSLSGHHVTKSLGFGVESLGFRSLGFRSLGLRV